MYFAALHAATERSPRKEVRELRHRARLSRRTLRRWLRRLARERARHGRTLATGRQTLREVGPLIKGVGS